MAIKPAIPSDGTIFIQMPDGVPDGIVDENPTIMDKNYSKVVRGKLSFKGDANQKKPISAPTTYV